MSIETKLVILAAYAITLLAATCSRHDTPRQDNSIDCVRNKRTWQPPSGITPGYCK